MSFLRKSLSKLTQTISSGYNLSRSAMRRGTDLILGSLERTTPLRSDCSKEFKVAESAKRGEIELLGTYQTEKKDN